MQRYTVLSYLETALHVSGGTTTHNQECKQLYLQHLVFVTPLLLPAAIAATKEKNAFVKLASLQYGLQHFFNVHGSVHRNNILIYIQQDATLHTFIIFGNCSTYFGWYHPKHVEQFPDIIKVCNVASCWIYIRIYGLKPLLNP